MVEYHPAVVMVLRRKRAERNIQAPPNDVRAAKESEWPLGNRKHFDSVEILDDVANTG